MNRVELTNFHCCVVSPCLNKSALVFPLAHQAPTAEKIMSQLGQPADSQLLSLSKNYEKNKQIPLIYFQRQLSASNQVFNFFNFFQEASAWTINCLK